MWMLFQIFRKRNKRILWKFSFFFLMMSASAWTPVDRLAFVVGSRPVTLSEVRAWVYLQSGSCLPFPLTANGKQDVLRMIASEKLYRKAMEFGGNNLRVGELRRALRLLDMNRGFRLLDPSRLHKCGVSLPVLEEVLRRELVVQHYIRSHSALVKPNEDGLMTLAATLDRNIPVTNLIFPETGDAVSACRKEMLEKH